MDFQHQHMKMKKCSTRYFRLIIMIARPCTVTVCRHIMRPPVHNSSVGQQQY